MKQVFKGFSVYAVCLLLTLAFACVMAQDTTLDIVESQEIPGLLYFSLDSEATGRTYTIGVGLPASYGSIDEHAYPVIYLTDAAAKLTTIQVLARSLAKDGSIPEVIIVGIHNAGETTRDADFSAPLANLSYEALMETGLMSLIPETEVGGADNFLAFIKNSLIPLINSEFATDPNTSVYFGHSFGGFFGLHAIQQNDDPFTHYLISSPSIWYDNRALFEREMAAKERTIYVTVGEFEQIPTNLPEDILAYFPEEIVETDRYTRMVDGVVELYDYFKAQEGIDVYAHIEEAGNHTTVNTSAFMRGMQVLLPGINQGEIRRRSEVRPTLPWE